MRPEEFEIFITCVPGLEDELLNEIQELGCKNTKLTSGGVEIVGGWHDVWRTNYYLRGATKVLVRFASFRAVHLSQLDKRSHKLDWEKLSNSESHLKLKRYVEKAKFITLKQLLSGFLKP